MRGVPVLPASSAQARLSLRAFTPPTARLMPPAAAPTEAAALAVLTTDTVRKPRCDSRSYLAATLPNGLRVLVAQDSSVTTAAACATVQTGYFDDELPGSAHFLEHAVHLGSEAYPDEREYKAFLSRHGGSSNASTSESPPLPGTNAHTGT